MGYADEVKDIKNRNRFKLSNAELTLEKPIVESQSTINWKPFSNTWETRTQQDAGLVQNQYEKKMWLAEFTKLVDNYYNDTFRKHGVKKFFEIQRQEARGYARHIRRHIETLLFDEWASGSKDSKSILEIEKYAQLLRNDCSERITAFKQQIPKLEMQQDEYAKAITDAQTEWNNIGWIKDAITNASSKAFAKYQSAKCNYYVVATKMESYQYAILLLQEILIEFGSMIEGVQAMKNEIIEKLKYFKGVEFHEKQHFYTLNNYRFGISATSLIETYAQEFDSNSISQMVANKRGISQQEVLNEWKKENEFSCIKGSCIHLKAQSLWMKENYEIDYNIIDDTIDKDRLKKEYDIMSKQAINFYDDYKDMYDMIQDEFIVWSKEFDIAGSIDGIMYNKYTQQCCILDFKSNKNLQFESKYHKKMKVPLHKLDDVNGQHYYIQLSIYKYLIEKYTNIKIDELFIVYFNINAKNYEIISIPYLKDEVEKILEWRKWE
jgi:hypothetical protein